jgi:hypothetical protein
MVSALCVRETAPADTDMLASETNRSDGRRATGLILERRPNQKATVSDGGNNSIEAENSSSCTIQISMRPSVYPLAPAGDKWNEARRWCDERSRFFHIDLRVFRWECSGCRGYRMASGNSRLGRGGRYANNCRSAHFQIPPDDTERERVA